MMIIIMMCQPVSGHTVPDTPRAINKK